MNKKTSKKKKPGGPDKKESIHWLTIIIVVLIICSLISFFYSTTYYNNPFAYIIATFFCFSWIVGLPTFGILKIPFSHELARKIEIFGYILLLMLILWQLVVRDSLDSMSNHDFLELKVDTIFQYLTSHDADRDTSLQDWFQDYYYEIADGESRHHVEEELRIRNYIVVGLQILSTLFIAIGRFDDISIKKKGNK